MHLALTAAAILLALVNAAQAEGIEFAAGQVWTTKDSSSPNLRVVVGRIEVDSQPKIVHVAIVGLPTIDRDATPVRGGIVGRLEGGQGAKFWCRYLMRPATDSNVVEVSILHLPIEYDALAASVANLTIEQIPLTAEFEISWDNWDYFKDEHGLDDARAAYASMTVPDVVSYVVDEAKRTISILKRIQQASE